MDAETIMKACLAAGLSVRMGDAGTLVVTPAARITPEIRTLIRDHKSELLKALCLPAQGHFDDYITCTACRNLAPGNKCLAHRRARLTTRDLAADFVRLKQRCDGFAPRAHNQLSKCLK